MRFTPPDDRQQAAVESVIHRYIYINREIDLILHKNNSSSLR